MKTLEDGGSAELLFTPQIPLCCLFCHATGLSLLPTRGLVREEVGVNPNWMHSRPKSKFPFREVRKLLQAVGRLMNSWVGVLLLRLHRYDDADVLFFE